MYHCQCITLSRKERGTTRTLARMGMSTERRSHHHYVDRRVHNEQSTCTEPLLSASLSLTPILLFRRAQTSISAVPLLCFILIVRFFILRHLRRLTHSSVSSTVVCLSSCLKEPARPAGSRRPRLLPTPLLRRQRKQPTTSQSSPSKHTTIYEHLHQRQSHSNHRQQPARSTQHGHA